jgi:hypothetical protein
MKGLEALKKLPKWLDDEHRDSEEEYFKASEEYKEIEKELKAFYLMKDYLLIEEKEELGLPCVIVSVRLPNGGTSPFYITHHKEEIELLKEAMK